MILLLALVGFIFALLVGLGTGGGALLVPVLIEVFSYNVIEARSIVLLLYIPISLLVSYFNIKNGYMVVPFKTFAILAVVGAVGVYLGNLVSGYIDTERIKYFYAMFLIIAGIYQLCKTLVKNDNK